MCNTQSSLLPLEASIFGKQNCPTTATHFINTTNDRSHQVSFCRRIFLLFPIQLKQKRRVSGSITLFDSACPPVRLPIDLPWRSNQLYSSPTHLLSYSPIIRMLPHCHAEIGMMLIT